MDHPNTNYHDSSLQDFVLGPRREIQLRVGLPSRGAVSIRFGAITNFETVRAFFTRLERPAIPGQYLDTIESLQPAAGGWQLCLDHGGDVSIQTGKSPTVLPLDGG